MDKVISNTRACSHISSVFQHVLLASLSFVTSESNALYMQTVYSLRTKCIQKLAHHLDLPKHQSSLAAHVCEIVPACLKNHMQMMLMCALNHSALMALSEIYQSSESQKSTNTNHALMPKAGKEG